MCFSRHKTHAVYPYLAVLIIATTFVHLAFLLGLMVDFGPAALLMLVSWCSNVGGVSPGDISTMLMASPWSHAGMLLAGCGRLSVVPKTLARPLFLFWCSIGMIGGMLLLSAMPLCSNLGLTTLAVAMMLQTYVGIGLGMVGAWWG